MKQSRENDKLIRTVHAGLFAALTALLTASLHIPVGNGYVHCGDAVIFLAASLLPLPYAVGAGAVGGLLADLIAGYPAYAPASCIIKGLLALCFSLICGGSASRKRCIFALLCCGVISVAGYWLTAVVLYGNWRAQLAAAVPGDCVQAAASSVVYAVIRASLRRLKGNKAL